MIAIFTMIPRFQAFLLAAIAAKRKRSVLIFLCGFLVQSGEQLLGSGGRNSGPHLTRNRLGKHGVLDGFRRVFRTTLERCRRMGRRVDLLQLPDGDVRVDLGRVEPGSGRASAG